MQVLNSQFVESSKKMVSNLEPLEAFTLVRCRLLYFPYPIEMRIGEL